VKGCESTTDAIFVVRQMHAREVQGQMQKTLFQFVDLEKAFDSPQRGDNMGRAYIKEWKIGY